MASDFDSLDIEFEFAEPFTQDKEKTWTSITSLYSGGLISLEQAVSMLALTDAPEEEVERIKQSKEDGNNNSKNIQE